MARIRIVGAALATLGIALATASCAGGDKDGAAATGATATPGAVQTERGVTGNFVGAVEGTDAFIAIATHEGQTVAYVCDGGTVAQWFRGRAAGETLTVALANGARLQARLGAEGASGTVTLADGTARTFAAAPATGEAGLYRATKTVDGVEYVAGWAVRADGAQRGAITGGGATLPGPRLSTTSLSADAAGLGTLSAGRVNGFIGQDISL